MSEYLVRPLEAAEVRDGSRRGVLSALMRAQVTELAERGVTTAGLYATEAAIYGRFGDGTASLYQSYVVDRRTAVLRPETPAGGDITLLDLETSLERLPGLYAALGPDEPTVAKVLTPNTANPAAFAARTYTGAPVVLEVADPLLPRNSGCYRVSDDGVTSTTDPADLRLGVDTLAMLYLGAWTASTLAAAGRVEANSAAALADADRLFGTRVVSWCGTFF